MADTNYTSGEDYIVEFLGYRFSFNAFDFEQRVVGAAVKLGLVALLGAIVLLTYLGVELPRE